MSKAKRAQAKDADTEPRPYRRQPFGLRHPAVERMKLGESVSGLARTGSGSDHVGAPTEAAAYDPQEQRIQLEAKIAGLEGMLRRKEMELDFLAGALRRIKETRHQRSNSGETTSTRKSAEERKHKAH